MFYVLVNAENLLFRQSFVVEKCGAKWAKAKADVGDFTNKDLVIIWKACYYQGNNGQQLTVSGVRTGHGRCGSLLFKWHYIRILDT